MILIGISLLTSLTNSDITLKCTDGVTLSAHMNLLSTCTEFFQKAVSPSSGFSESEDNTVSLEYDSSVVKAFLQLVYTDWYEISDGKQNPCMLDVQLFVCINFLLAENLKPMVLKKASENVERESKNPDFWAKTFPDVIACMYDLYLDDIRFKEIMFREVVNGLIEGKPWKVFADVVKMHTIFAAEIMERCADAIQGGNWVPDTEMGKLQIGKTHNSGPYHRCPSAECCARPQLWHGFCKCRPTPRGSPIKCCQCNEFYIVPPE